MMSSMLMVYSITFNIMERCPNSSGNVFSLIFKSLKGVVVGENKQFTENRPQLLTVSFEFYQTNVIKSCSRICVHRKLGELFYLKRIVSILISTSGIVGVRFSCEPKMEFTAKKFAHTFAFSSHNLMILPYAFVSDGIEEAVQFSPMTSLMDQATYLKFSKPRLTLLILLMCWMFTSPE